MTRPHLIDAFRLLPQPQPGDDPDAWAVRFQTDLEAYRDRVAARYTESTLQRLLTFHDPEMRRAAVTALGLVGTMASNAAVADSLHDPEDDVRQLAEEALWAIWFRGGPDEYVDVLTQLARLRDAKTALAGLERLVRQAPDYAEAINQRAIAHFRRGEFGRSASDCERVLAMNPYHFGAAAGLGQCRLRQNRPKAALDAFRTALRINPNLMDVERVIRELEHATGDGGPFDGRR